LVWAGLGSWRGGKMEGKGYGRPNSYWKTPKAAFLLFGKSNIATPEYAKIECRCRLFLQSHVTSTLHLVRQLLPCISTLKDILFTIIK
jgi:hypothetical protein